MRHGRISRGAAVASLAVAAWVAVSNPVTAQTSKTRKDADKSTPSRASNPRERASGVIVKVEPVKAGATSSKESSSGRATHRLTINTDAVWRDWARDQSQVKDTGSPKKDAAKGENSIATAGEPGDANSVVVVDVGPDTRIETRFRSPAEETDKGAKTPEAASGDRNSKSAKTVRFRAEDLKPGLFVEVDYRHVTAQNPATVLAVIRPIGGPDSGSADKTK